MKLIDNGLIRGALAGAVATVPMTLAMLPQDGRSLEKQFDQTAPSRLVSDIEGRMGVRVPRNRHRVWSVASHFGFGAVAGALFAVTLNRWSSRPAVKGPLWGLAIWGISYLGWVPALRLSPAAQREPQSRNIKMVVSHLVWGLTLARLVNQPAREIVKQAVAGATGRGRNAKLIAQAFS